MFVHELELNQSSCPVIRESSEKIYEIRLTEERYKILKRILRRIMQEENRMTAADLAFFIDSILEAYAKPVETVEQTSK